MSKDYQDLTSHIVNRLHEVNCQVRDAVFYDLIYDNELNKLPHGYVMDLVARMTKATDERLMQLCRELVEKRENAEE